MAKIREDCLPPPDLLPDYFIPAEYEDLPDEITPTVETVSIHISERRDDNVSI